MSIDENVEGSTMTIEEYQARVKKWDDLNATLNAYTAQNHIPYKGTFELTARCSLKCKMCYMRLDQDEIERQGRELTTAEWIRMGEMAAEAGTADLLISGGEPMLRTDFKEIYTALTDMGFYLRLYTNATLVTPEIARLIEERPPFDIEVSIYGASRETYAKVAGWADGYDRMVEGVDTLRKIAPMQLKTTIIRDNAGDFKAMCEFARNRGLLLSTVSLPMPAIRGAKADVKSCRLNLNELLKFHEENSFDIVGSDCQPPHEGDRCGLFCSAGLSSYSILWNGTMVACLADSDANCVKGYPLEEGFGSAWSKMAQFREGKPLPLECQTCAEFATCSSCSVGHMTESGSYDKRNLYRCAFYKAKGKE